MCCLTANVILDILVINAILSLEALMINVLLIPALVTTTPCALMVDAFAKLVTFELQLIMKMFWVKPLVLPLKVVHVLTRHVLETKFAFLMAMSQVHVNALLTCWSP